MNILLDFLPFQHAGGIGGHSSFAMKVTTDIIAYEVTNHHYFAVYDSKKSYQLRHDFLSFAQQHNILLVDLSQYKLSEIIKRHQIDVFFIAIGQLYQDYDLKGITCKTIMFIHDIFDVERCDNKIDSIIYDPKKEGRWEQFKRLINLYSGRWNRQVHKSYQSIMPLYGSDTTIAFTVSNYTRQAIYYHFPQIKKDIRICFSPLKYVEQHDIIENEQLRHLIESRHPFLLMIAANRKYKNPQIITKVFPRLKKEYPDLHLLTLKYGKSIQPGHIDIDYLSDSDLEHAYQKATALVFASFFEGFGYPPVEAMKYGTPTIASNVTSIPEILGDAAIYFSPIYPADFYRAAKCVLDQQVNLQVSMAQRYEFIKKCQIEGEQELIQLIFNS